MTNNWVMTLTEVRERTNIANNVHDNTLTPHMRQVHLKRLTRILGKALYDEIVDQVTNETLTSANNTLLEDYLKDLTAWLVATQYHKTGHLRSGEKGVNKEGEHQDSLALYYIAVSSFDTWKEDMLNFIDKNIADYPSYNLTTDHEIYPKDTSKYNGSDIIL